MRLLGPGDVDSLVDPHGLLDAVREALTAQDAAAPLRASLEYRGTWFAAMPAAGLGYHAVKAVGVYPGNPGRGLPLVRGLLLLFDAETGEPLLAADAHAATGWRTAAASALAAGLLGYRGGGRLGLIGAGAQAWYHGLLFTRLYKPAEVLVYSRTRARAEALASRLGGRAAGLEDVLASDVVVAATTAREPVVRGRLLKPGAVVLSVGAPRPVVELDPGALERAGCLLVDTREGYWAEAGEAARHPEGVPVVELREALGDPGACRPRGDVGVYKSVGTALLDLGIAVHLHRRLGGGGEEA